MKIVGGNRVNGFPSERNIPILGEKFWKQIDITPFQAVDPGSIWPPTKQQIGVVFPHGLFLATIRGIRSDDVPCGVTVPCDARLFQNPPALSAQLNGGFKKLQDFLACACTAGQPCKQHLGGSRPSGRESSGDPQTPADIPSSDVSPASAYAGPESGGIVSTGESDGTQAKKSDENVPGVGAIDAPASSVAASDGTDVGADSGRTGTGTSSEGS